MPIMSSSNISEASLRKIIQEEMKGVKFRGNDNKQKRVFISHSFIKDDFLKSQSLQVILKEYGIDSYIAEEDKQYGYILSDKIREAIQDSIVVIVIITKNSISSPSVNQEVGYALGLGMTIIPLVSEDVKNKVGVLLTHVEGEYFVEQNFKEKCKTISENISKKSLELKISPTDDAKSFNDERGDF